MIEVKKLIENKLNEDFIDVNDLRKMISKTNIQDVIENLVDAITSMLDSNEIDSSAWEVVAKLNLALTMAKRNRV